MLLSRSPSYRARSEKKAKEKKKDAKTTREKKTLFLSFSRRRRRRRFDARVFFSTRLVYEFFDGFLTTFFFIF